MKKNEPAHWQLSGVGGESVGGSDNGEDEGMAGGISVGMGGLDVVDKETPIVVVGRYRPRSFLQLET